MSDDDAEAQAEGTEGKSNKDMKRLREKAAKADEMEKALADARRENAILKSGIDADSPLGKMFLKAYDGDFSDTDALKAAAAEIGVPLKGQAEAPPSPDATAPSGTTERQALADGAPADTGLDVDPYQTAHEAFKAHQNAPWEEAAGEMVHALAERAMAGDPRVIYTGAPNQ